MKTIYIIVSLISLLAQAGNNKQLPDKISNSVFRIKSMNGCATGFLTETGHFITNAHVVAGACDNKVCKDFELYQQKADKKKPELFQKLNFNVISVFPLADLAVLKPTEVETKNSKTGEVFTNKISINENIGLSSYLTHPIREEKAYVIGFPGCDDPIQITETEVTDTNNFELTINHFAKKGESGSPILNQSLDIIGVLSKGDIDIFDQSQSTKGPAVRYLAPRVDFLTQDLIYYDIVDRLENFSYPEKFDLFGDINNPVFNSNLSASLYFLKLSNKCPELHDYMDYIQLSVGKALPPYFNKSNYRGECLRLFYSTFKYYFFKDLNNFLFIKDAVFDKYRYVNFLEYMDVKDSFDKLYKLDTEAEKIIYMFLSKIILIVAFFILIITLVSHYIFKKFPKVNKLTLMLAPILLILYFVI